MHYHGVIPFRYCRFSNITMEIRRTTNIKSFEQKTFAIFFTLHKTKTNNGTDMPLILHNCAVEHYIN